MCKKYLDHKVNRPGKGDENSLDVGGTGLICVEKFGGSICPALADYWLK